MKELWERIINWFLKRKNKYLCKELVKNLKFDTELFLFNYSNILHLMDDPFGYVPKSKYIKEQFEDLEDACRELSNLKCYGQLKTLKLQALCLIFGDNELHFFKRKSPLFSFDLYKMKDDGKFFTLKQKCKKTKLENFNDFSINKSNIVQRIRRLRETGLDTYVFSENTGDFVIACEVHKTKTESFYVGYIFGR